MATLPDRVPVPLVDALGLSPLPLALRQAKLAVFGDGRQTKGSRFDVTSLHIFTPRLSVTTWLGRVRDDRKAPIMNFVNRTPTPVDEGWSVRVTQVRDWRGGRLTYDSHNGTDFVVPPGSRVCAAAPGRVVSIRREFNRGGLKLYIDHGGTLVTTSNHLARVLVQVGDMVDRGQVVAISGYSGIDAVVGFPWVAPHIHYNVWFGGIAADPYAASDDETSLWRRRNDPVPWAGDVVVGPDSAPWSSSFSAAGVARCLAACRDPQVKAMVEGLDSVERRGAELLIESITYPLRFTDPEAGRLLFEDVPARTPRLDLPLHREQFDGTVIIDR
jgi:murein DD-endopeptidase MepM/ murein hydrolase activator NlpD